jgi:hypothetical protein
MAHRFGESYLIHCLIEIRFFHFAANLLNIGRKLIERFRTDIPQIDCHHLAIWQAPRNGNIDMIQNRYATTNSPFAVINMGIKGRSGLQALCNGFQHDCIHCNLMPPACIVAECAVFLHKIRHVRFIHIGYVRNSFPGFGSHMGNNLSLHTKMHYPVVFTIFLFFMGSHQVVIHREFQHHCILHHQTLLYAFSS